MRDEFVWARYHALGRKPTHRGLCPRQGLGNTPQQE
jgi:hypothetical protein